MQNEDLKIQGFEFFPQENSPIILKEPEDGKHPKLIRGQYDTETLFPGGKIILILDKVEAINKTGIVLPRSTIFRNGLSIQSGFIDNGFSGHIKVLFHNTSNRSVTLKTGFPVAQVVWSDTDCKATYQDKENNYNEDSDVNEDNKNDSKDDIKVDPKIVKLNKDIDKELKKDGSEKKSKKPKKSKK